MFAYIESPEVMKNFKFMFKESDSTSIFIKSIFFVFIFLDSNPLSIGLSCFFSSIKVDEYGLSVETK